MIQLAIFSEADMLPCLSQQILGISCPGCGLQRAVALLLRGVLIESFLMYPALLPLMALFAAIVADRLAWVRNGTQLITWLAGITVTAILVNFLLKLNL